MKTTDSLSFLKLPELEVLLIKNFFSGKNRTSGSLILNFQKKPELGIINKLKYPHNTRVYLSCMSRQPSEKN